MRGAAKILALIAALAPAAASAHCGCDGHERRKAWSYKAMHAHPQAYAAVFNRTCSNYPGSALRARASGVTWVAIRVGDDGWTRDARVSRSSGRADLDRAALACVRDWRFHDAGRYDWRAVRVSWRWVWSG